MKHLIFCLLIIVSFCLDACVDKESQMKVSWTNHISEINQKCPSMFGTTFIRSIRFCNDTIEAECVYEEQTMSIDVYGKVHMRNKDIMDKLHFLDITEIIVDSQYSMNDLLSMKPCLKVKCIGSTSGDFFVVFISPDEFGKIASMNISEQQRNSLRLRISLSESASRCPYSIEKGMTTVSVYEEGGYVTFRIEMDEKLYSIDLLKKASVVEVKKAMKEELISNAGLQLYSELLAAKRCGCGFKYLYVGDKSGKTCSFQLESSELPTIEELEQKINECLMCVR